MLKRDSGISALFRNPPQRTMKTDNKPITWLQFNNLIPIVTSLIIMTLAFAKLQSDIALLNQKVDNITYNLCAEFNKYTNSSGKNQILMMNDYNGRSWTHPAGRYCFEQTINQNLYLKPVPLMR